MKLLRSYSGLWLGFMLLLFTGCKQSMVISEVDYSQPIERVLVPNDKGVVKDVQHGISFNILPLQYAETQDTSSVTTNEIRMIRGKEGYYYITAPGYSNVYVMAPEKHQLKLTKKIKISEQGIDEPAFNQRNSYVQLLNRKNNNTYALTEQGIRQQETSDESEQSDQGG